MNIRSRRIAATSIALANLITPFMPGKTCAANSAATSDPVRIAAPGPSSDPASTSSPVPTSDLAPNSNAAQTLDPAATLDSNRTGDSNPRPDSAATSKSAQPAKPIPLSNVGAASNVKAASNPNSTAKIIHGSVSENALIDNLERVGIKCILQQANNGKTKLVVDSVRMGSTAFYKGIASGDLVKGLATTNDLFTLSIERNGQSYQIQLKALKPLLASTTPLRSNVQLDERKGQGPLLDVSQPTNPKGPLLDVNQPKIPIVPVDQEKDKEKKLVQYDIELIIDITGSMGLIDGTDGKTKFQWCHDQVRDFAQRLSEYQKTFTITTYNTRFKTERNCNASRVEEIYATITPSGNTDLVDPLSDRLNDGYIHRKPGHKLLIAVITDGLPNVPRDTYAVDRAVVDFTHKMTNADDAVVTILQIGDTFDGKEFCIRMDDNLVNEGARYDIVDTRTFDELKSMGMISALVAAITEKRSTGHAPISRRSMPSALTPENQARVDSTDAILRRKVDEREALEKILNLRKPVK